MTNKPTFKKKFRYWFDNLMASGTPAMVGMLAFVSLVVVLLAGAIISFGGINQEGAEGRLGFGEAVWESLMRTFDAGTMGADTGTGFRVVMLLVTIGGIFVVSALIGVLNSGLEVQLERLRKGRSQVLESDHTIILGWSPQIFTILSELVKANENRKKAHIVILAGQDKVEMEEAIRERIEDPKTTRIICRHGNPIDLNDLEIASPHTARSIIVLPPDGDDPDTYVIKTVLALTNNPNRRPEPYHIVTQIRDEKNLSVLKMIGGSDHVQPVLTGDLIARVVAQTSRQSGLSVVYTELLDFGGDEIYFKAFPELAGKTYGEALLAFETSAVMGVRRADGTALLNPPMDLVLGSGDQVFAITADDDTLILSGLDKPAVDAAVIRSGERAEVQSPEKALVLGWNRCTGTIIRELDHYVPQGSSVLVIAETDIRDEIEACAGGLANQRLTFQQGDTTSRQLLDGLEAHEYDHVIVLAYAHLDMQDADAKTLVTLLHLRDIAVHDDTPFSIVSEMLDLRNRQLAEVAQVDDFIVSDHLISLMLAQLSENDGLFAVFNNIFDPEGSEAYLKPVEDYVAAGQPVNFYTVVEAARQRGQTAIGYRVEANANDPEKAYGVVTNPKKSAMVTFHPDDRIIVISED
ncbi:MAG: potassium transporter TrkA [Chloroflexota bacterium]